MKDERLPENAARMGQILMDGLRDIQADYPVIGDVRGLGLMVAAEFVTPSGESNTAAVAQVLKACLDEKVLLLNCGTYDQVVRIIPPLIINEGQVREFIAIFRRGVATIN